MAHRVAARVASAAVVLPGRGFRRCSSSAPAVCPELQVRLPKRLRFVPPRPRHHSCPQITREAVSPEEEANLVAQVEKWMVRRKYEGGHFDKVITQYRELQKPARFFSEGNKRVLERVKDNFFPADARLLPVHILDLAADGEIGLHVDHVEYSGRFIIGLSLLSDAVMRFRHESSGVHADIVLPRRSVYVMTDATRYDWAHAIPMQPKGRRISLLFRDANPADAAAPPPPASPS